MQTRHRFATKTLTLEELEKTFSKERQAADKWYARLLAKEQKWRKKDLNMDAEFASDFYKRNDSAGPDGAFGTADDSGNSRPQTPGCVRRQ